MSHAVPQLRVQDVAAYVQDRTAAGGAAAPVLLDVREAWELQTARIALPGLRVLHIPMGTLPARLHELDRALAILSLCHHGARSLRCAAFLQQQGYTDVVNIAGGIDAWSREVDPAVPRY